MRTTTRRRPHGPPPLPRRHLNPDLYDAVRNCGTPGWLLAYQVGITHHAQFSALINAEEIPASAINIERLERIAEAVGFPKSRLFVGGAR